MGCAFMLGASHLGTPSLWHDELVHTFVGKSLAETGEAKLPSGVTYRNGTTHNFILAASIKLGGLSEVSLRLPSVLFATLNVLLLFLFTRPLLGRATAIVASYGLALSPWCVAWSREARFYTLQQGLFLVTLIAFWQVMTGHSRRRCWGFGVLGLVAYALALLTSYHSMLFLSSLGMIAGLTMFYQRQWKSRWVVATGGIALLCVLSFWAVGLLMNTLDHGAVVDGGNFGGMLTDTSRDIRDYYLYWLRMNLSVGFYGLALIGFVGMVLKPSKKNLFVLIAFWTPLLLLTFFVGYRRPRFMFFIYPLYVVAWSYALVQIVVWLRQPKIFRRRWYLAIPVTAILLRVALSFIALTGDSMTYAGGANTTLARKHPQWRAPCLWVKDHQEPDTAILSTTYLPVLYYTGRIDNWYPARDLLGEQHEAGNKDLMGLEELQAFIKTHPRGYFFSEYWRFDRFLDPVWQRDIYDDALWVSEHMTRIEEASNEDITVWSWGLE